MRGKKAAINTAMSLLEELVAVICGFILPRLILTYYGSKYNGLTSSITQFLSCAVLLRSGIGGATRAALYKPLAENNKDEINGIVKATDQFMKKIGLILAGSILVFAMIYPFMVKNEFGWLFTFSLFVIIGTSTFAESFFGITYLIVLQADQRLWVSALMKSICYILNTVIGAFLIIHGASIHAVKLGSAIVFVLYPIVLGMYVKAYYRIDTNVAPNNKAIAQRWDAFWQQIAVFVMNNTDVMVLTVFSNMLEVSVYSVYNMIMSGLKRTVTSLSNGLEAAFGNMIAKKEQSALKENVAVVETLIYGVSTVAYTCAAVMIFDFIRIYTKGINDVNYIRYLFAYIMIVAQFFNGVRLPYQLVVQAAGHYKQTKKGAIVEPIINISLSILFVIKFGIVGVAVGTLAATIFRTLQYSIYMSKNIVHRNPVITFVRCMVSLVEAVIVIKIATFIPIDASINYKFWIYKSCITVAIAGVVVILGSVICFREDVEKTVYKMKNIFSKK